MAKQTRVFHLNRTGRIAGGPDAGRYLRIIEQTGKRGAPGGYIAEIAADEAFAQVVGDQYLGDIEAVADFVNDFTDPIDWR